MILGAVPDNLLAFLWRERLSLYYSWAEEKCLQTVGVGVGAEEKVEQ